MSLSLVYDGDCGTCNSFKDAVAFLDCFHHVRPFTLDAAEESGALDAVPTKLRRTSFHLIMPKGNLISGADAIPVLAGALPGGSFSRKALKIPPVAGFVRYLYAAFVRVHRAGSCDAESIIS